MKKLLIVTGTTATGKTSLAIKLAKIFNGEIISADSRQVYAGMDIGTGKDLPKSSKKNDSTLKFQNRHLIYYQINQVKIWGYDIVQPDEEFSLAHYKKFSDLLINHIWKTKKIPIVVGGTGLYLKAITEPLQNINIPPDNKLRHKNFNLRKLQSLLEQINSQALEKMNQSDRKNPRRIMRTIEIENYKKTLSGKKISSGTECLYPDFDVIWIGLKTSLEAIRRRINQRVDARIKNGALSEVSKLIEKGFDFDMSSMSAMGYSEWREYFAMQISKDEAIKRWKTDEFSYAKRQITWFKRNKNIKWFDVSDADFTEKVVCQVKQWYSES